jgi:large subunit ribosomal protein L25
MKTFKLTVEKREHGKKSVKAVRNNSMIPVEIYGKFLKSNISGSVLRKELVKGLHTSQGKNIVFDLQYDGQSLLAVAHDLQIHPVKTNIIHVDFMAVNEDQHISVTVPVKRIGRSKGEIAGGRVFQVLKEVKVSCTPKDIPSEIVVDVTENEIGDRIKISELPYPENVVPVFVQDSPVIVLNKGRGQSLSDEESAEDGGDVAAEETEASAEQPAE